MTLKLGMVTFDTRDPMAIGAWWAQATGGQIVEDNDGWFVIVAPGDAQPNLAFQKVEDPTPGKNRVHLDLGADDPDAEVERLLAAGATKVDRHEMGGFAWTVLADPEGNQFCVSPTH